MGGTFYTTTQARTSRKLAWAISTLATWQCTALWLILRVQEQTPDIYAGAHEELPGSHCLGQLTQGHAFPLHCYTCGELVGAQMVSDGAPAAAQLLLYATVPGAGVPAPLELFAPIITTHLVEQSERHAAHHFVVEAPGMPRLVLWLFQPLVELVVAPPLKHYVASKILYREADASMSALDAVPIHMGHSHARLLHRLLLDSSEWSTPSRLGPWMVGWLPRT